MPPLRQLILLLMLPACLWGQADSDFGADAPTIEARNDGPRPSADRAPADEPEQIFERDEPPVRENPTITESAEMRNPSLADAMEEAKMAGLLEDAQADLSAMRIDEPEANPAENRLARELVALLVDAVVTALGLALLLRMLGAPARPGTIVLLSALTAGLAAGLAHLLRAPLPDPLGLGIAACVLAILLRRLPGVRKTSTAAGIALLIKIDAGIGVWLVLLAIDAVAYA